MNIVEYIQELERDLEFFKREWNASDAKVVRLTELLVQYDIDLPDDLKPERVCG